MEKETVPHGDNLLIAMSNTEMSLGMVRAVAAHLADPHHTRVTLMHYLMPIYWEHGGDMSNDRELHEVMREEEQVLHIEDQQEERSRDYFQKAKTILTETGVPADEIRTRLTSDGSDVAHAVLQEVEDGDYTAVVVGERDRSLLEQVFSSSLADFLKRHTNGTEIWDVSQP